MRRRLVLKWMVPACAWLMVVGVCYLLGFLRADAQTLPGCNNCTCKKVIAWKSSSMSPQGMQMMDSSGMYNAVVSSPSTNILVAICPATPNRYDTGNQGALFSYLNSDTCTPSAQQLGAIQEQKSLNPIKQLTSGNIPIYSCSVTNP